jgi:hypothetical protein
MWSNIASCAVILAAITSISGLAWIAIGPTRSPAFLKELGDSSLELTACLIVLYAVAFFFDISRAKEFWMNREMGFYTVVAALFFAACVHDFCLLAQNGRLDRGVTEELVALGLLWTGQFWRNDSAKSLFSMALSFHGTQETKTNEVIGLGLSSDDESSSNPTAK